MAAVSGWTIENTNGNPRLIRLADNGYGALAVLRDHDNTVHVLGNGVADLFELTIGILVPIAFKNPDVLCFERFGYSFMGSHPVLGFKILKGKADGDLV